MFNEQVGNRGHGVCVWEAQWRIGSVGKHGPQGADPLVQQLLSLWAGWGKIPIQEPFTYLQQRQVPLGKDALCVLACILHFRAIGKR